MMPHLDPGLIHELVDGEVASVDLPPIQAHLATCNECRTQLEAARRYTADADRLIEALDGDAADVTAVAVPAPQTRPRSMHNLAWAASVIVAVGVGYAARGTVPPPRTTVAAGDAAQPTAQPTAPATVSAHDAPAAVPTERLANTGNSIASARANDLMRARRPERRDAVADEAVAGVPSEVRTDESATPPPAPRTVTAAPTPTLGASGVATRDAARPTAAQLGERASAFARQLPAASKMSAALDTISLADAMRLTGGRLRFIDRMIPQRLEARGAEVRVVYLVTEGELVLIQQLVNGVPVVRIVAPRGFPADSVARLEAMVRD